MISPSISPRRRRRPSPTSSTPDADFVRFGHWEGDKQGLLAGDALGLQLRQLEAAYIEGNRRTYEARRPVSLRPARSGRAGDFDRGGRLRVRAARMAVRPRPARPVRSPHQDADGPFALRHRPARAGPRQAHPAQPPDPPQAQLRDPPDVRFDAIQSIVTSSGVGDTGLFETNLQDARYLPFEGCGAVARFRLELPDFRQFDLTTLSDVILTVSYTAREGGNLFRDQVIARWTT